MTDRAVSSTLEYVFGIAIATLLLGALIGGTAGLVETQQDSAIRSEMEVLGQRLAADLTTVDRLAQTNATTVRLETSLPERVAGVDYDVNVTASGEFVFETEDPEISITIGFVNATDIEPTTLDGGDLRIEQAADGDLEVTES